MIKWWLAGQLMLMACTETAAQVTADEAAKDLLKIDWLIGNWIAVNGKSGETSLEHWEKNSPQSLKGWGMIITGKDSAVTEKINIIIGDDHALYYVAEPVENREPTRFKMIRITGSEFACENPLHDFPNRIVYIRRGDLLKATISGKGKSIDYLFKRAAL